MVNTSSNTLSNLLAYTSAALLRDNVCGYFMPHPSIDPDRQNYQEAVEARHLTLRILHCAGGYTLPIQFEHLPLSITEVVGSFTKKEVLETVEGYFELYFSPEERILNRPLIDLLVQQGQRLAAKNR